MYRALQGNQAEGELWSEGPKTGTAWVIRTDGKPVVVQVSRGEEVEYQAPEFLPPLPASVVQWAAGIVESYKAAKPDLAGLGATPADPNWEMALIIQRQARASNAARTPFLDPYPTPPFHQQTATNGEYKPSSDTKRMPVSMRRLRELSGQ